MKDTKDFSHFLISHLHNDFIPKWERYLDNADLDESTYFFHSGVIRFLKGTIKYWRRWLIQQSNI